MMYCVYYLETTRAIIYTIAILILSTIGAIELWRLKSNKICFAFIVAALVSLGATIAMIYYLVKAVNYGLTGICN